MFISNIYVINCFQNLKLFKSSVINYKYYKITKKVFLCLLDIYFNWFASWQNCVSDQQINQPG